MWYLLCFAALCVWGIIWLIAKAADRARRKRFWREVLENEREMNAWIRENIPGQKDNPYLDLIEKYPPNY